MRVGLRCKRTAPGVPSNGTEVWLYRHLCETKEEGGGSSGSRWYKASIKGSAISCFVLCRFFSAKETWDWTQMDVGAEESPRRELSNET